MASDRKHVTICSKNDAFNGALRLLLDDFEVHVTSDPEKVAKGSDVLVWRVNSQVPFEQLIEVTSSVPTLVMTSEDQLISAVDAGCRGFLPDSASLDEIHHAVTTVVEGGAVVPPDLLGTLLHHLVERRRRDQKSSKALAELTEREHEVFQLAIEGLRKQEIAERLYISPDTARTHLQRVYRKLDVHSQSELMALAMRIGEFDIGKAK